MGKDKRKEVKEVDDSLGKKVDKWGKGGDGKKEVGAAAPPEKSWTHQTVRHILSQKMSDAVRISEEIHNGEIGFNEAAFKYSEDKAGAHGLLGDKAANELDPEFWAMWKTRPIWPASAAQAADWPRLAEAQGSLRHDLALKGASGEPAGRGLSRLVFHIGTASWRRSGRSCPPTTRRAGRASRWRKWPRQTQRTRLLYLAKRDGRVTTYIVPYR